MLWDWKSWPRRRLRYRLLDSGDPAVPFSGLNWGKNSSVIGLEAEAGSTPPSPWERGRNLSPGDQTGAEERRPIQCPRERVPRGGVGKEA